MESLVEDLTLSDLEHRIAFTAIYIDNVKRHSHEMKAFLPIFENSSPLPISHVKYEGTIAYINWILRSDELFLNLNVTYYSTGKLKCALALSQLLALVELTDVRNVRTLDGKRFRKYFTYSSTEPVHVVVADRIISSKSFAIIENGLEAFKCRDKILEKFGVQSPLVGV